eukprot:TRINITY_DN6848_c0_g1_i3.p1 TRINITY_DN6848_c0_g1~~TRINITY_DN6848_c0_g1_i3.p1  ORF type:complete len:222 (+),score=72.09 TRINITY_DN6848_c0_g1_i3:49-714(+)
MATSRKQAARELRLSMLQCLMLSMEEAQARPRRDWSPSWPCCPMARSSHEPPPEEDFIRRSVSFAPDVKTCDGEGRSGRKRSLPRRSQASGSGDGAAAKALVEALSEAEREREEQQRKKAALEKAERERQEQQRKKAALEKAERERQEQQRRKAALEKAERERQEQQRKKAALEKAEREREEQRRRKAAQEKERALLERLLPKQPVDSQASVCDKTASDCL